MIRNIFFFFIICLVLFSCRESNKPISVSLDKRQVIILRPPAPAVTYAYLPQYSNTESFRRHHQLVEYLSRETGIPLRQVFPESFNNYISMFGQGQIDISFSNPFVYVKLANRYGARAMARVIEANGKGEFRGQIIARKDNQLIRSIEDCRGKSWVAVDPLSAGGYLFPLGLFVDRGIKLQDFKEVFFAGGRQENVILGVYAGLYEIGTIREGSLGVVKDKIDITQLKVIDSSKWYPGWVYACSPKLSEDVVGKIRNALLKLDYTNNPQHRRILDAAKVIGLVASDDRDFDPVRDLSKKVGVNID